MHRSEEKGALSKRWMPTPGSLLIPIPGAQGSTTASQLWAGQRAPRWSAAPLLCARPVLDQMERGPWPSAALGPLDAREGVGRCFPDGLLKGPGSGQ